MSKWLKRQENCVSGSMAFLRALLPSHAMVMETSSMLYFYHMSSTMIIMWIMHSSSLLYIYWSWDLPGVVLTAVVLWILWLLPSMTSADVPHSYLKNPSLTAISVPFWIPVAVCLWVTSSIWYRWLQSSGSISRGGSPSEGSDPVHFTIYPDIFSVSVGMLYVGVFLEGRVIFFGVASIDGPTLASQDRVVCCP